MSLSNKAVTKPFFQERVASIFYTSIDANVPILANDFKAPNDCTLRTTVALDTTALFCYTIICNNKKITLNMNDNTELKANAGYTFDIPIQKGDLINFQVNTASIIFQLRVFKI